MTSANEKRYKILTEVIPVYCNMLKSNVFYTVPPEVDVVCVNRPEGLMVMPPLLPVDNVVEHYWDTFSAGAVLVRDPGTEREQAYTYDGAGWLKEKVKGSIVDEGDLFKPGDKPPLFEL